MSTSNALTLQQQWLQSMLYTEDGLQVGTYDEQIILLVKNPSIGYLFYHSNISIFQVALSSLLFSYP